MRGKSIEAVGKSAIAMPVVRERLDWLDALRGIGIIAVVAGHIWTRGAFRDGIYCFHMPLFFMASGAVARAVPTRILAPRLLLALGLPTLSFAVLFLGLDYLVEGARQVRPIFPDALTGLWTVLTGMERLRGPFAILWFAPCLIAARLAWNSLQHRLDPAGFRMMAAMALVLLIALLVDRYGTISPLGLLSVPGALIFIWLGHRWKDRRPGLLFSAATLLLAVLALGFMPPLNMRAGDLGWPLLGIAGAAAIVDRIAWIARRLPDGLTRALAWIGRNSLVIMFLHLCFAHYLAPYFPKVVLLVLGVAGPLSIGALMRRNRLARLLFLGER
ncbi:MAG: acyltransferase family protein [Sphingobium sp.]|nr:acyltransferase family protein [Sphingobium sp.]